MSISGGFARCKGSSDCHDRDGTVYVSLGSSNMATSRYFTYYIPFFAWIKQYKWEYLQGDFVAAITMASLYIPMALSYAANLGHVPPINGLYSFVFNPVI